MDLIRIEKKNGQDFVSSLKEIYLAAGMDSSNWSRWYVKNVEENLFFAEGQEYQLFVTKTNGRDMKDIACTLDMAKHLIMQMSTEKAFAYRQYLIDYENKTKLPGTYKKDLLALVAAEEEKDQLSVIGYAEKFGHIDQMYKICCKLYETEVNLLLKELGLLVNL